LCPQTLGNHFDSRIFVRSSSFWWCSKDPRFPVIQEVRRRNFWGIASLVDAFHVPKLLSQQLLAFGRSGDGLEVLTFEVEQFSALSRACGGRSAAWLFVVCSSCSCSPSFLIRCVFEFWLGEVSDGPRVPGGQSAGAWRTVSVLPADGPFFGVRFWRFCWL
jgi:hypothetical protein